MAFASEVRTEILENLTLRKKFRRAQGYGLLLCSKHFDHVTHIYHVYDDAPHAVAAGKGTDAEGWLNEAAAFWEEEVG